MSAQDVKGATAEPHRLVALEQEPLRWNEAERAKRDRACVHEVASPNSLFFTRFYLTAARARGPAAAQVELARVVGQSRGHPSLLIGSPWELRIGSLAGGSLSVTSICAG